MKRALICGISGQDGAYLAEFLLGKGYEVVGTSRDAEMTNFSKLDRLGIRNKIAVRSMSITDFRSVVTAIREANPDEIYNLAGQSSVSMSFNEPVGTMESIAVGTLNLLESIRFMDQGIRLYNAGSSECFGDTGAKPADESSAFRPRSPYAVAKSTAHMTVANYREAYGIFGCNGILFNHESPLRPLRFVTRKIVRSACEVKLGLRSELRLGNLEVSRDWGYAPEYVEPMWLMLQQDDPTDYVIATGQTSSLEDFTRKVFEHLDLRWNDHVVRDASLLRPSDIAYSAADPGKAAAVLGWRAKERLDELVKILVDYELVALKQAGEA